MTSTPCGQCRTKGGHPTVGRSTVEAAVGKVGDQKRGRRPRPSRQSIAPGVCSTVRLNPGAAVGAAAAVADSRANRG